MIDKRRFLKIYINIYLAITEVRLENQSVVYFFHTELINTKQPFCFKNKNITFHVIYPCPYVASI